MGNLPVLICIYSKMYTDIVIRVKDKWDLIIIFNFRDEDAMDEQTYIVV